MAEPTPQTFGKYVLLSKIAAGGMAVTYRARMTGAAGVTKPCVIKQILPHFVDDEDFVEMFIGEARLVASMSHSNIAQIFDFGEVDGQYFIAMELVQGQPLSKVLRRAQRMGMGFFPESLALHVASKLCDGLDYAHRHVGEDGLEMGLVHRDVSPDNVLISYEGEVKVIDFGIAKATSAVEAKTSPGTLKGKYPYFAPEQAQGRQDLDARTDVYAAGVVLYEMVCGKRPYEGEFVTVLPRILQGDCLPPTALNPSMTQDLENVIAHAMAVDRDERFQTAKELSASLVELLYRDNPRFTPSELSQLMAYLFAEELTAEGRKAEVTPAFLEQVAFWQASAGESSQSRARPLRPSNPGLRSKPGSDGGAKPPTDAARRSSVSNPSLRKVTSSGNLRRVTNTGLPRTEVSSVGRKLPTSERLEPPVPELPEEPDTDSSDLSQALIPTEVPSAMATLAAPRDTPVENPVVTAQSATTQPVSSALGRTPTGTGHRTTADEARETLAKEAAEQRARQQKAVKTMSLYVFGAAAVALFLALLSSFVFKSDTPDTGAANAATLWVTSTPEGAKVKLNGRDVAGKTPLMVEGILVGEANTLVLTLPGHLAWTRRFTPVSMMLEPLKAELQPVPAAEPATPPPAPPPPATPPPVTPPAVVAAVATGTATEATVVEAKAVQPAPAEDAGAPASEDAASADAEPSEDPVPLVERAKQMSDAEREFLEVDYPTRLLVVRPMYNAALIPEYITASIDLNPNVAYSVWTQGTASLGEGKGTTSGTLAYFIEGDGPADSSFGLLSASARTIKNARKLYVFAVDETGPEDNSGSIHVVIRQSAYVPPRSLMFDAQQHAVQLRPEQQVLLRGLNPRATYLFTVRDDIAELRTGAHGRVHQVLCVERGTSPASVRATHRILETGKRYQITGAEDLRCFFPDATKGDNQGALEMDIVDTTSLSRKERAAALRGSRR
ncbi:protein kinase [Myxococcus stipitatus]|uniref:protein kinase domain-containing protein n=1 Tax=Myxococcus stipitatus TaxID=83455 RepID=UPI00324C999C